MTQAVHSVAQSIVCCIGTTVAGQPTQFLFERAVASLGTDWRAISVEVTPEDFKTACEGMLAMRFHGLRIFGDLQAQATQELASDDAVAGFVGHVSSGELRNHRWICWDQAGYAWVETVKLWSADRPPIYWLHGDSRTTRSTFVALSSPSDNPRRWIWTHAPDLEFESPWRDQLSSWMTEGRIHRQSVSECGLALLNQWLTEPERPKAVKKESVAPPVLEGKLKLTATSEGSIPSEGITVPRLGFISEVTETPGMLAELLGSLAVELAVSATVNLTGSLAQLPIRRIQPAELAVAGEAYDFHRWTSQKIDTSLLQDAYDEYCDF